MRAQGAASGSLELPIQLLSPQAQLPSYAHPGDAGLDLCSVIEASLEPFERKLIPCGIAVAIPEGYAGLVVPRSGLAAKHGISVVNGPGLIDSGYRGEIKVVLINLDAHETFSIGVGDRIAQLVIIQAPSVSLKEALVLPDSVRNDQGFGSSGR